MKERRRGGERKNEGGKKEGRKGGEQETGVSEVFTFTPPLPLLSTSSPLASGLFPVT